MLNFIAGVRSSSPAPSSRHLAISSQHLLVQARAHKTMDNLEEAQKSYRYAIEKAKIEHEENPGNLQAKRAFDKIRDEFLTFLNELPLDGHPISSSAQAKNAQVEYLFEKALSTLGSLELPNKPSLFLVYAHDNPSYGKAEAAISRYLIDKLSQIQVKLYSDQTPMGQPSSRAVEDWKEDGKLEDILTSQLCLLPTRLRNDVEPVGKVVVCCSEVLGSYLEWKDYKKFHEELREAYNKDLAAYSKDGEQKDALAIRQVVNKFSRGEEYKAGFHHVLTEMAFLQIRAEQLTEQHGIIPVSLTPKSSKQCLGGFIAPTTVRMEGICRFEEQAKVGREVYLNQGEHLVLFKLIERLLVGSDEAQTFLSKFWQGYDKCISRLNDESSTPGELEFTKLVDSIFGGIEKMLRDQLVLASLQQHKDRVEKLRLPNLPNLREALYQHYQLSNLSIQRVSGETASLDDCYINLAIVESQVQREKDKEELEKQAAIFERLPSSERIEATNPNKLILLEKLFEVQKLRDGSESVPKRILIQGRAGIGKTTLCKKLIYEYYQKGLWQDIFENILWVPLRQLKTSSIDHLEDLLCRRYFSNHGSVKAQALGKTFLEHQGKTLFILDGLDEVTEIFSENHPLNHFLKHLLNQPHVLITSRPAGVNASQCNELDLELETIGFSSENVQNYIQKFAPESNQIEIQQFINCNSLILGLVNIPIQLDALCYSWDKLPKNREVTMTMLYEAMVDKLWRKDSIRLEKKEEGQLLGSDVIDSLSEAELEDVMAVEVDYLGYLAFKGLEEGKIEFSRQELGQRRQELNTNAQPGKRFPIRFTIDLKKTSYLHTADAERPENGRHYHFLHLTFQEFFAAKFLVKHLQTYTNVEKSSVHAYCVQKSLGVMPTRREVEAFVATHKYNPRYEIVWWMVAGLLKGTVLENFFNVLDQSPRDLIGMRHQQVILGCLNEARDQLTLKTVNGLEKKLIQWFHFEMKLGNGYSQLSRHRAFPEHLLIELLDQPGERKAQIILTLGMRPALSETAWQILLGAFQDENRNIKLAAVHALKIQSTLSERAEQVLIGAFQDEHVRFEAVRALGAKGTLSEVAEQALIGILQEEKSIIRFMASIKLACRSTLSEAAAQALISTMQHDDEGARSAAAFALGGQSKSSEVVVQALIGALQDENFSVRSEAARALKKQKTLSETAEQALIGALQHKDREVRTAAASALEDQSKLSEVVAQALIGALQDKNLSVRFAAANALEKQKVLSETAQQALIGTLQHKDENVSSQAVSILKCQNTLSKAATKALIDALQNEDWVVSFAAAGALRAQNGLSEAIEQFLIDGLQNKIWAVRFAAARALEGQSALSEAAEQALIGALQDENIMVRFSAISALKELKTLSEAAEQTLICALQHENRGIRHTAAHALEKLKTLSEAAEHALISACQDKSRYVRSAAVVTLGKQKVLSETAEQALINTLQDQSKDVRSAAVGVLEKQRILSEAAMLALVSTLQDKDEDVSSAAARVLEEQKTVSKATVHALMSALKHEDWDVKTAAINLLGKHIDLIYSMLSTLSLNQIEAFYTEFFFNCNQRQITALYVQDHQLHFYTAKGPGQAEVENLEKIIQAFEAVQIRGEIKPMRDETLLVKEA